MNLEQELFSNDLKDGTSEPGKSEWTKDRTDELYDLHGVGSVKNALCLRLHASSIYEIANSSQEPLKMMSTIIGESLLKQIADFDKQIYESIEQTIEHLCWKLRKSHILVFRRKGLNHGWKSVRQILINVLGDRENKNEKLIAGMSAVILLDVFNHHVSNESYGEEAPLLSKTRFPYVFRMAFRLFNDSIEDYILGGKSAFLYEVLACRLAYFYTRLVADTWRILVIRNGPKLETEWFMLRSSDSPQNKNPTPPPPTHPARQYSAPAIIRNDNYQYQKRTTNYNYYNNNNYKPPPQRPLIKETVSHESFMSQFANPKPLRKY